MTNVLAHRGPDSYDYYTKHYIGLGHRRLSILDLSEAGKQPMHSEDGRYHIIFNGEIFNFQELRAELSHLGYHFRSHTDTEVLLKAYVQYGSAMLDKLNGMFAFAIWDSVEQELFLARDRVGVKPLYYAVYNDTLYFASEPKSLFRAGVPALLFEEGLNELLLFRYIAGENTTFKWVKRLLPGHCMTIRRGSLPNIRRWWNLAEKIQANRENLPRDPFAWFEETFYSSVAYRTISDVPVGIMLSGGLDSGSVAAGLHHNGQRNMAAFTVAFEDANYNEAPLARLVAQKFDLDFHSFALQGAALLDKLKEATWYHDEPLIHQNDAQMLALAQYAKPFVTVLLSGEGGDELMGGYVRYKALAHSHWATLLSPFLGMLKYVPTGKIVNRTEKLQRYLKDTRPKSLVLLNALDVYPTDLESYGVKIDLEQFTYRQSVLREATALYPHEPARQAMYLDLFTHMASILDRNDRMTMGASIECRVPFLDYRFLEMLPALPSNLLLKGKKGKYLLFDSVARQLPEEVRQFKKLGFSVPWQTYIAREPLFQQYLQRIRKGSTAAIFANLQYEKIYRQYQTGEPTARALMRQLLMVELWQEAYLSKFDKVMERAA
jgi:asparagine synthase (glutamine-hydrolysing)